MAIVKMKRLRLLAMGADREKLLEELAWALKGGKIPA